MSSPPPDLKALRRSLDEIDDRLQDLLIDRTAIIARVAASKRGGDQPAFQPAREAEIIRRLVERHHGTLPVATLVRMWREMLAATVQLQSPFSVAVCAPAGRQGYWDLARDHYGSYTPMTPFNAANQVLRVVAQKEISVGVLPMPESSEADPWWPQLVSESEDAPRVIARLPFGASGNGRNPGDEALVIGWGEQQASGLDRTLFAMECSPEASRAGIVDRLAAAGLACTLFVSCDSGAAVHLIELDGFVPRSDARLTEFRAQLDKTLERLFPLGGYAVPLPASAFSARN
ncbi:MAG: chorismate mutase [Stellaceae bacterium]